MPKAVLDTNVRISAILTPGNSREILELVRRKRITLLTSEAIIAEIERVLKIKIHKSDSDIFIILEAIRNLSIFVSPYKKIFFIKEDGPDNRILECAAEGGAQFIVSGDGHLLDLKKYKNIKILSPGEFLEYF